ncbi:hypothetical protein H0G86_001188 [Trichoderma simmonsii]|uniref:Uncharacterized protein n=1 Tax=Trichoderma simmonsii TaxID=1491479 RepID=A0A8G0L141_9HYPO|nr:hypothetical protein H0G86_001188 [Trichoderma simmonsii]
MSWNLGAPCARRCWVGNATGPQPRHARNREIAKDKAKSVPGCRPVFAAHGVLRHTEPPYRVNNAAMRYADASRSNWGNAICCFVPDDTRAVKDPGSGHDRGIASEEEFNAERSIRNDGLSLCVDPGRTPLVPVIKYMPKGADTRLTMLQPTYAIYTLFLCPLATSRKGFELKYQMSIVKHNL